MVGVECNLIFWDRPINNKLILLPDLFTTRENPHLAQPSPPNSSEATLKPKPKVNPPAQSEPIPVEATRLPESKPSA